MARHGVGIGAKLAGGGDYSRGERAGHMEQGRSSWKARRGVIKTNGSRTRSSFNLQTTYPRSSVTPTLAGPVDVVHRACDTN